VLDLLSAINEAGTTIIMVTHERTLAKRAQRNITVRDGRVGAGDGSLHIAAAASA
jgi:putative ABC transport system ATP-binding protein